ncbi:hypothetical protein BS47DRAFT_1362472 [Hydnum rufescens UP504]|uniref:Uncharacterized protein n=1 Tax=Hydnum rufescens UP504 TaxID=1448309 RepID=A0A9P6AWU3_9AGAM|nr:hypothetical protein BS47DRAFT_1362472 [Hydnum rufescens UP504]
MTDQGDHTPTQAGVVLLGSKPEPNQTAGHTGLSGIVSRVQWCQKSSSHCSFGTVSDHLPPDETPYDKNTDDTPPKIRMHAASPMKCCEIDHWNAHAMKSHLGYMRAKPLQNAGT